MVSKLGPDQSILGEHIVAIKPVPSPEKQGLLSRILSTFRGLWGSAKGETIKTVPAPAVLPKPKSPSLIERFFALIKGNSTSLPKPPTKQTIKLNTFFPRALPLVKSVNLGEKGPIFSVVKTAEKDDPILALFRKHRLANSNQQLSLLPNPEHEQKRKTAEEPLPGVAEITTPLAVQVEVVDQVKNKALSPVSVQQVADNQVPVVKKRVRFNLDSNFVEKDTVGKVKKAEQNLTDEADFHEQEVVRYLDPEANFVSDLDPVDQETAVLFIEGDNLASAKRGMFNYYLSFREDDEITDQQKAIIKEIDEIILEKRMLGWFARLNPASKAKVKDEEAEAVYKTQAKNWFDTLALESQVFVRERNKTEDEFNADIWRLFHKFGASTSEIVKNGGLVPAKSIEGNKKAKVGNEAFEVPKSPQKNMSAAAIAEREADNQQHKSELIDLINGVPGVLNLSEEDRNILYARMFEFIAGSNKTIKEQRNEIENSVRSLITQLVKVKVLQKQKSEQEHVETTTRLESEKKAVQAQAYPVEEPKSQIKYSEAVPKKKRDSLLKKAVEKILEHGIEEYAKEFADKIPADLPKDNLKEFIVNCLIQEMYYNDALNVERFGKLDNDSIAETPENILKMEQEIMAERVSEL